MKSKEIKLMKILNLSLFTTKSVVSYFQIPTLSLTKLYVVYSKLKISPANCMIQ